MFTFGCKSPQNSNLRRNNLIHYVILGRSGFVLGNKYWVSQAINFVYLLVAVALISVVLLYAKA